MGRDLLLHVFTHIYIHMHMYTLISGTSEHHRSVLASLETWLSRPGHFSFGRGWEEQGPGGPGRRCHVAHPRACCFFLVVKYGVPPKNGGYAKMDSFKGNAYENEWFRGIPNYFKKPPFVVLDVFFCLCIWLWCLVVSNLRVGFQVIMRFAGIPYGIYHSSDNFKLAIMNHDDTQSFCPPIFLNMDLLVSHFWGIVTENSH